MGEYGIGQIVTISCTIQVFAAVTIYDDQSYRKKGTPEYEVMTPGKETVLRRKTDRSVLFKEAGSCQDGECHAAFARVFHQGPSTDRCSLTTDILLW
jgi:hypothetical protein